MNTSFAKPPFSSFSWVGVRMNCSSPGIPDLILMHSQRYLSTSLVRPTYTHFSTLYNDTAPHLALSDLPRYLFKFVDSNDACALYRVRSVSSIQYFRFRPPFPPSSRTESVQSNGVLQLFLPPFPTICYSASRPPRQSKRVTKRTLSIVVRSGGTLEVNSIYQLSKSTY